MSSCRDTDRVSANVMPMDREPAKIGSNCRRLRRGNGMTAQPDTPVPDTGSYEVIHLGGQAAVVVPVADFLRLRALERAATSSELENAEDTAFLDDPPGIRAVLDAIDGLADDPRPAGSFPYGSPDVRLRVGRYRSCTRLPTTRSRSATWPATPEN
jgi:hypothetical protein